VIKATQLKKDYSQENNNNFEEDVEWLEKFIDNHILHYRDTLLNGKRIDISEGIHLSDPPYLIEYRSQDLKNTIKDTIKGRIISKNNFLNALNILQEKYKKSGWKISLKGYEYPSMGIKYLSIKKHRNFWKSLFSKNRKEYSSILDEMEKKYS